MVLKYKVLEHELKRYHKKILYCEVIEKINVALDKNKYIYKVRLINMFNRIDIFNSDELHKLNLIDRLILLFKK